MSRPLIVLCIDDDVLLLAIRKALLESSDFKVLIAENGPAGLEIARREPIDVVILDYKMPGMDGARVAEELRKGRPNIPILLSSGLEEIPESLLMVVDGIVAKGSPSAIIVKEIERVRSARQKPPEQVREVADRNERVEHSRGFARSTQLRRHFKQKRTR